MTTTAKQTTRPRRTRNGPSTESRILDVAENLFAEYGFDAVSINQLATVANVTIGALYHHFPSKEALYAAVTRRVFTAKSSPPLAITWPGASPREQLTRLVSWFVGTMILDKNFGQLLKRELLDPRPNTPELIGQELFQSQRELCKQLLGELVPGANPDEGVAAMLALLFGYTNLKGMQAILPGIKDSFDQPEAIAERVVNLLLHGLQAEKTQQNQG
ncbi:TetR/AcrR family transcriptional regulator [Acidocella sp. KAb 2-4]|uniref:TetR/AcrR family transcriptional regulator n=1 Tax=Acidocella sp. KAb 2-4 TaxID=2885158 RepID=UPI001D07ADB2|nr:TetR/AcrR family transcriptional regulator [Acidocella sp. KAb 2-4]MCB5944266.1 TetR/AcrR family transcriptional regulator [Acidocella sp. KAb 2-4]